jgi:thioredoxin 1
VIESINEDTFVEKVTNSSVPVLVDFWAEWCGPCRMMKPILEEISQEYIGKVQLVKMNVDDNASFSAAANLRSIPTFILYVEGVEVKRVSGARTKKVLLRELEQWIK